MAESGETAAATARGGGRSLLSWKAIALALLALVAASGGGAAYVFFFYQPKTGTQPAAEREAAPPFYLEIKPFVVSMMMADDDTPHFVQLGANLTLSGAAAGKLVEAYMPEVEDTMRQTMLAFKVGDVTTPAGVDKMRALMTANINRLLLQRLGAARIERDNGGKKDIVQNIFFSTLVVE